MKQIFVSFCIGILLAVASGCSNVNSSNSPTSAGGSITGVVSLGSILGKSSAGKLASSAGVSISLDGTSISTMTDSSGFWKLDNVPAGNYDVTITKSGFGLFRSYGVAIGGPGTAFIPRVALGELPTQVPEIVSANLATISWVDTTTPKHRDDLQISWKAPFDATYYGLAIFIDKDPSVRPADVHYYSTLDNKVFQDWLRTSERIADPLPHTNPHDGVFSCPIETLHARGITSGMKIYITIAQWDPYSVNFGEAPNNNITYYDPIHNQNRLISPSPASNVVALTMP